MSIHKTIKDEAYTHRRDTKDVSICQRLGLDLLLQYTLSTGIRKGALVDLRLKHLIKTKIDNLNLYKFTIYENTKEEYITFCTPECASMIDELY